MTTLTLTSSNFDQIIKDNEIVFIDFWAEWCGPCLAFAPIYEEIAKQFPEVMFGKIDIEKETALANEFEIRSIPMLMVFKKQIVIFSQAGVLPGSALKDLVTQAKMIDMTKVEQEIAKREGREDKA